MQRIELGVLNDEAKNLPEVAVETTKRQMRKCTDVGAFENIRNVLIVFIV